MNQTTTTTQPVRVQAVDGHWDTGDLGWPVFGIILVIAVTVLALFGKLPGFKAKLGDKAVEVDPEGQYQGQERRQNTCAEVDPRHLFTPLLVTKRRTEANNAAWARQKSHADEIEDDFWPILDRRGCDQWQAEAACNRLHRVLYNAADQNHILEVVCNGVVQVDYLEDKVQAFRRRYEKLSVRPGCTLPPFATLSEEIRSLLSAALVRFAEIALEEESKVSAFAEALKKTADSPDVIKAIDEAASRGLPEVA